MSDFYENCIRKTAELIPYALNSRTHSEQQVAQIAASIREFGFTNPILVDEQDGIIAGHGRVMAANLLDMDEVPCVIVTGLSEAQKKALVIADNQLALNSEWNMDLLKVEIEALHDEGFNLDLIGFDNSFLDDLADSFLGDGVAADSDGIYTDKVESPNYEPKGDKPDVISLYDNSRTRELINEIKNANVTEEEKDFLLMAAGRHTILDFEKIANYYAHSEQEMQELMENSALVIIDFKKAIELGYVKLSQEISEQYTEENPYDEE